MIQRIQTLFLLAVVVLSGLLLTGDLLTMDSGSGTLFTISFQGLGEEGGEIIQRLWPLSFLLALVPVVALVALFLGAFYVIMFDRKIDVTIIWKIKVVFPLISAILAWLAHRAILRDDLRVKAYDRLR
jgi:hypothetical protein